MNDHHNPSGLHDSPADRQLRRCCDDCVCPADTCRVDEFLTELGRASRAAVERQFPPLTDEELDREYDRMIERANNRTPAEYAEIVALVHRVERDLGERHTPLRRLRHRTTLAWYRSPVARALHRAGVRVVPGVGRRVLRAPRP